MNKLISIVVPVYNADKYIEETIESVQKQEYQEWELLLVDDYSMDKSISIMEKYMDKDSRIRILKQASNQGAWAARNRGVKEAKGRYLAFLDADDIWEVEKLNKTKAFMEKENTSFAFTSYEFANEEGIGNGNIAHVPSELSYRQALKNTIIFTSTVMIDLNGIEKEKIYMKQVKSEDTATWWSILREGQIAYGLDEVLVRYRRPKKSLSSNKLEAVSRIWNLYRKEEKLSVLYSCYNFFFYAIRTTLRRI